MRLVVRHHRRDVDDATAAVTQSETDSGNETWNNPTNTNTKNDDLICKRRRRRRRIWSEMNDDDPIWMKMMNKLGDDQTIADVYTTLRQPFLLSYRLLVVYTFTFSLYH